MIDLSQLRLKDWNGALWDHFVSADLAEKPLYLNVDEFVLQQLAEEYFGISAGTKDVLENFNQACWEAFEVDFIGEHIYLNERFFDAREAINDAISLAAQQVLAANLMQDSDGYTHNAFYIRYRELLGLEGHGFPFTSYKGFELVWSCLRAELISKGNVPENKITFYRGEGRDKYRRYPMSQALFSIEDLRTLTRVLGMNPSDYEIRYQIRGMRRSLTKRGGRLVRNGVIFDDLVNQVRNFCSYEFAQKQPLEQKEREFTKKQASVLYSLPVDDWLSEEIFSFGLASSISPFMPIEPEQDVSSIVLTKLMSETCLGLISTDGMFVEVTESHVLEGGDTAILIQKSESIPKSGEISESKLLEISKVKTNLSEGLIVSLISVHGDIQRQLMIGPSGLEWVEGDVSKDQIALRGGICMDSRSKSYLYPYVPTGVEKLGNPLSPNSILLVNGVEVLVEDLESHLLREGCGRLHNIQFGELEIEFESVAEEKWHKCDWGFEFDRSAGRLSPELVPGLDDSKYRLIFSQFLVGEEPESSSIELGFLRAACCESKEKWVSVPQETIDALEAAIQPEIANSPSMRIFALRMRKESKIPLRIHMEIVNRVRNSEV